MKTLKAILLAAAGPTLATGPGALAQTVPLPPVEDASSPEKGQLEDIVVTAQKRSERLQDVPIAVTALNAGTLQNAGVDSAIGLAQAVPGLSFNTQIGGNGLPRIRGVGVAVGGPGLENPVAVYIDGVYYASAASNLFALYDVAQVAVLKGPQGTLFGRNATGGLIQVTTRDPSHSFTADVSGTAGNKKTVGGDVYVAGGLNNQIAASLALHLDNQDHGFGNNLSTGEDVQTHHSYSGRAKLLFEPDTLTKFTFAADYSRRRGTDFAVHVVGLRPFIGTPQPGGARDVDLTRANDDFTRNYGFSLNGQRDFGGVRLVSVTAYRKTYFQSLFDGDEGPLNITDIASNQHDRQFSQELQLLSVGNRRFSWQAGAFFFKTTGLYDPFITNLTSPLAGGPAVATSYATEKLTSYAGFGQGTYKIGDATNITAGLRYTTDKRTSLISSGFKNAFFTAPPTITDGSKRFSKITWRLALDRRFSADVLGYVSYNRGFKSGAFDPSAQPSRVFKPETLDAYEAGVKTEFLDHRVRFNTAAFYYDYKNVQVTQFSNHTSLVYNGKGATSYGVDTDLLARVTDQLTLNAGASWIHGRYKTFLNAFRTVRNPGCIGALCGGNTVTLTGDATGNKLQNTPAFTLNVGPAYRIPVSFGELTFAGNFYYNSGYYSEPENRLRQPHYSTLEASIAWTSRDKRFDVRVFGRNLTDKVYAAQLAAVDVGDVRVAAPGRSFGVTGAAHF